MQQQAHIRPAGARMFIRLALATATLTIGLIVFGAVVRVTDSGLGCGSSWPLCNGTIFPPLNNVTAWIEWLHRLFALLIGVMGLATLVMAWRIYRHQRLVFGAIALAAILFVVQSTLGALTVILHLPPTVVALHLGTAMLLLAALLIAVMSALYQPSEHHASDSVSVLTYITTALSLVIILTGALVRGSGATLACVDWPLCYGAVFPVTQGSAALIHMLHRFAVVGLGIALLLLLWQVFQARRGYERQVITLALAAYLTQAGIGALFVLSRAAPVWGAAHVGFAAVTWAMLVILSGIEFLSSQQQTVTSAAVTT